MSHNRNIGQNSVVLAILIAVITIIILILTSCNRQIIDMNYTFDKAIIDDVGEIEITSWSDYGQSDMIQITDKNGKTYLTHSSKVILIHE